MLKLVGRAASSSGWLTRLIATAALGGVCLLTPSTSGFAQSNGISIQLGKICEAPAEADALRQAVCGDSQLRNLDAQIGLVASEVKSRDSVHGQNLLTEAVGRLGPDFSRCAYRDVATGPQIFWNRDCLQGELLNALHVVQEVRSALPPMGTSAQTSVTPTPEVAVDSDFSPPDSSAAARDAAARDDAARAAQSAASQPRVPQEAACSWDSADWNAMTALQQADWNTRCVGPARPPFTTVAPSPIPVAQSQQPPADAKRPNKSSAAGALVLALAIFGLVAFVLFFLPTVVAFSRSHRNRWVILLINVVFGATVIGWIGALIWAMNKVDDPLKGGIKHDPQPHDPIV